MALTPSEFEETKTSSAVAITKTTNSYYSIDTSGTTARKLDDTVVLVVQFNVTTPNNSWIEIASMNVSSAVNVLTKAVGAGDKACDLRVNGTKIYASGGTANTSACRTTVTFFTV